MMIEGYKDYKINKENILTPEYYDRVRERLGLTKKQLSDATIRKVVKISNGLIGEWIVNNADGFRIKNNGILIVSKYLPKCLRGDKQETIEAIMNNPKNDNYMKEMFTKRYNKSLTYYKNWGKKGTYHVNPHSFFYLYRVIWFNSRNCAFPKAEIYEFKANEKLRDMLNQRIIEGRDFYEWNFSDFRIAKRKEQQNRKFEKEMKEKKKKELKLKKLDTNNEQ